MRYSVYDPVERQYLVYESSMVVSGDPAVSPGAVVNVMSILPPLPPERKLVGAQKGPVGVICKNAEVPVPEKSSESDGLLWLGLVWLARRYLGF